MMANCNFLSPADRAILVEIARDGLEEHRIARRANALILLDRGMKFEEVAQDTGRVVRRARLRGVFSSDMPPAQFSLAHRRAPLSGPI